MRNLLCLMLVVTVAAFVFGCQKGENPTTGANGDQKTDVAAKTDTGDKKEAEKEQPAENTADKPGPDNFVCADGSNVVSMTTKTEGKVAGTMTMTTTTAVAEVTPAAEPVKKFRFLINCGGEEAFKDWNPDQEFKEGGWGFVGGDWVVRPPQEIAGTDIDQVYLSEHFGMEAYRITCPNGKYTVKLHFAETWHIEPGLRVFNVTIEGNKVLEDFDPLKEAGEDHKAVVKTFDVEVKDGELTIEFESVVENPMINGIEIESK